MSRCTGALLFCASLFPWIGDPLPVGAQGSSGVSAPVPSSESASAPVIVVPAGKRLPLVLSNGINTRTAKAGDSIYLQTIYPIAINNRIVIPMGSFVRGELLHAKRPGFVKGRGEIRIVLSEITFANGYTLSLVASPSSLDRDGKEAVDREGKIIGPSNAKRDAGLIIATTAGGAYIGTLAGAATSGAAGKGAAIGAGTGATAGILAALLTRGPEAELPRGTLLDVMLDRPLVLDVERLPSNDAGTAPSLPPPPPASAAPRQGPQRIPRLWPIPGI